MLLVGVSLIINQFIILFQVKAIETTVTSKKWANQMVMFSKNHCMKIDFGENKMMFC